MSLTADVGVVGVGTAGSMALWRLAKRGISAHGFDQFGLGHDRSAAGGETRLFRSTTLLEDSRYVPLAADALVLWRELEAEAKRQLLTLNGHLIMGPPDSESLERAIRFARQFGLQHQVMDGGEVSRRFPQHAVEASDIAFLEERGGYIRPELSVLTAAQRARELGATIHTYTQVKRVDADDDVAVIATVDGEYRFQKVIVSAGPWLAQLVPAYADRFMVKRVIQAWFAPRNPRDYRDDVFPVFLRTGLQEDLRYFYGVPVVDGAGVKLGIAGTNQPIPDPDQLNRTVGLEEVAAFSSVVEAFLPGLHPDPIRAQAYMEGYTPDGTALVGPLPDNERIIVLGGFSGGGFKFSPVMGELAAECVVNEPSRDISMFAPGRAMGSWQE